MVGEQKTYQLDTNVVIQMLHGDKDVIKHIYEVGVDNCCICEITIAELYYGAVKGGRKSNYEDIDKVEELFRIVPVYDSFETLAKIRLELKNMGKMIDAYDMMIGASAVNSEAILVTHNTKHYENIPGIVLEDWQTN